MLNGMSILAIIPARGGSKGVKRKNIRDLSGKPLIAWTIEEAKKSNYIDRLVLSTEDDEIANIALTWGCEVPFKRPLELAKDDTPGIDPVLHAMKALPHYDYVLLLQPTSPLRNVLDIDACIEYCILSNSSSCVSVTKTSKSPYWMYYINEKGYIKPVIEKTKITRRQDLPETYVLNGAIYIATYEFLLSNNSFITNETIGFVMDHDKSIDIDSELDLKIAEAIIQSAQK